MKDTYNSPIPRRGQYLILIIAPGEPFITFTESALKYNISGVVGEVTVSGVVLAQAIATAPGIHTE